MSEERNIAIIIVMRSISSQIHFRHCYYLLNKFPYIISLINRMNGIPLVWLIWKDKLRASCYNTMLIKYRVIINIERIVSVLIKRLNYSTGSYKCFNIQIKLYFWQSLYQRQASWSIITPLWTFILCEISLFPI
jgi:hypothetical protein